MKTLIIIENENVEQESTTTFLNQIADITIHTVRSAEAVEPAISEHNPDLVICDISSSGWPQQDYLSKLTQNHPYIPCLAISDADNISTTDIQRTGAEASLSRPLTIDEIAYRVEQLLALASHGTVSGIPLHSLLGMLESEEKSCTLRVFNQDAFGRIYIDKGIIIAAETTELQDEEAFYAISSWENTSIEIKYFNCQLKRQIHTSLISLISESHRLKEATPLQQESSSSQIDLKRISSTGSRLSLDIGAKVKLEFAQLDLALESTLVGMVPNSFLIVTTPMPFSKVKTALDTSEHLSLSYIHTARLCTFNSRLLHSLDKPQPMLILEYPQAIHYHELRRAARTSIFIPCTVHLPKGPEYYGELVDMSSLGCQCRIKTAGNPPLPHLAIDTAIELRCLLPGFKEDQELRGLIKNIKTSSKETGIGIEFFGLDDYLTDTIDHYLYSMEIVNR